MLVVSSLQLLKQEKLEVLAEALPLPILFESRRKKTPPVFETRIMDH
jgi:hypothetical protein